MARRGNSDRLLPGSGRGTWLECVPNFSEGRARRTIRKLEAAGGPLLLDTHSDASHHRTVLTLAGDAMQVRRAALRLFEIALRDIDLRRHRGEHPRTGALDVLPIVPLEGASMDDAVRLARSLGKEIGASGAAPVFLYGRSGPNRRPLPEIRRGGLPGLSGRLSRGEIAPDFGPTRLHPSAGAVSVGARQPLIAFNQNLDTDDAASARRIARRVRASSGGLPALRAIGVRARDPDGGRPLAQVSMNLLDWRTTALPEVFDRVLSEARTEGTEVLFSEIVGLLPRAAAWPGMEEDLRLRKPARTIEAAYAAAASGTPP